MRPSELAARLVPLAAVIAVVGITASCGNAAAVAGPKVWIAAVGSSEVVVINPATNAEAGRVKIPGAPDALALASDALWVSDQSGEKAWRIDKATNEITDEVAAPAPAPAPGTGGQGSATGDLTYGQGKIIMVSPAGSMAVIDPTQRKLVGTYPIGQGASSVAVDGQDVWVGHRGTGEVTRHRIADGGLVATVQVGGKPAGMLVADGQLWVTNQETKRISKISTATNSVGAEVDAAVPTSAAIMHGGKIWVATDDSLLSVDPATAQVVDQTRIGGHNVELASAGEATIWVTDAVRNVVYRIDPTRGKLEAKLGAGAQPSEVVTDVPDAAAEPSGSPAAAAGVEGVAYLNFRDHRRIGRVRLRPQAPRGTRLVTGWFASASASAIVIVVASAVVIVALALALVVAFNQDPNAFNQDPKAYEATAGVGFAKVEASSAGGVAVTALGDRFGQADVGASSVAVGGWGTAGSATEPLVVYAVITGGSDVRDKVMTIAFGGMGPSQPQNYSVETNNNDVEGSPVKVVIQRGPDSQIVVAVASPNPDVTIFVTSPVGNVEAVNAALASMLKNGRVSR